MENNAHLLPAEKEFVLKFQQLGFLNVINYLMNTAVQYILLENTYYFQVAHYRLLTALIVTVSGTAHYLTGLYLERVKLEYPAGGGWVSR